MTGNDNLCPFCRAPAATSEGEDIERAEKRVEMGDAQAIHNLGCVIIQMGCMDFRKIMPRH